VADCPVDGQTLRLVPLPNGWSELACGRCTGVWLPGELVRATLGVPSDERLRERGSPGRLRCPSDGTQLFALHRHGVEIDVCAHCTGVWLDAGERERIPGHARSNRAARRELASDLGGSVDLTDLVDVVGEAAGQLLEFVGDVFSGL